MFHGESYEFDPTGMRTAPNGDKTKYYYDGLHVIGTSAKASGQSEFASAETYALRQSAVGQIISKRDHGTATDAVYSADLVGNITAQANSTGAITEHFKQDAYGNIQNNGTQSG